MSWSDFFYPENPGKRERLIRKNQEIRELMKNNFRATNQLIGTLKKFLGLSFSPITLNEEATVKENCDVIINRIREIQVEVAKIDEKLKEKLEPTLYEKLKNRSLSSPEFEQIVTVVHVVCDVAAIAGIAFHAVKLISWVIKNAHVLTDMSQVFFLIGGAFIGAYAFKLLFTGIDIIIQAIAGSYEQEALDKALEEYDRALEEFRPASENYQDQITYVRISLERR